MKEFSALSRVVTSVRAFAEAWESIPLVSEDLDDFSDIFSASIAERVMRSGFPLSALRIYRNGKQLPGNEIPVAHVSSDGESLADGMALLDYISGGATVILEHLKLYCAEVAAFADALSVEVGFKTYCAAFITPAGTPGLVPHYDTESVFLRQVYGAKRWHLQAPIQRWPINPWRSNMQLNTEPVLDVTVARGDSLYIPRGYIHGAEATREGSIHLTISIIPITWAEVLLSAVEGCSNSDEFRECIPPSFLNTNEQKLFHRKLTKLQNPALDSLRPEFKDIQMDGLISALRR